MEQYFVTQTQNDYGCSMNVDTEDTPIDVYTYVMEGGLVVQSLSPMGHEISEGLYRVPVHIENEQHTVYVGDNHKRMFDADSLPDFMKHKLAMITISDQGELLDERHLTRLRIFETKRGDLECIGWRVSSSFYIVIMTDGELESLKGSR
jgi:hypothetical protein